MLKWKVYTQQDTYGTRMWIAKCPECQMVCHQYDSISLEIESRKHLYFVHSGQSIFNITKSYLQPGMYPL